MHLYMPVLVCTYSVCVDVCAHVLMNVHTYVHVFACDMRALERPTIVSENQLTYLWLDVECILTTDVSTI